MKYISIITVNFNHSYLTEQFLESFFETNNDEAIEVIVVDNGSKDNPVPAWIPQYPTVKFIRSEKNLGFAGGNNLGIAEAKGEYFFLVNNDTELTPGLVRGLAKVLDDNPKVGMVSPKIRYFDDKTMLQYVGFTPMNYVTCRNACIGQFETDKGQYDHVFGPTGYIHGAAMMVRKEAMDKAGLMADYFFLYYEEMDWCDRIKRAGYEAWVNASLLIYHKESVSVGKMSGLKEYFMNRNRILFIRRNAPLYAKPLFYIYFTLLVAPRNILSYIKTKHTDFIPLLLKAIWWNISQRRNSTKLGYPLK